MGGKLFFTGGGVWMRDSRIESPVKKDNFSRKVFKFISEGGGKREKGGRS